MFDFCQVNDLMIGNTFWRQKLEEKYTFVAEERNARSLIDHIVYTKNMGHDTKYSTRDRTRAKNSIQNGQGKILQCYYIPVGTKEYIKIKKSEFKKKNIQEQYQKETDQQLRILESTKKLLSIEDIWNTFKDITYVKAKEICRSKKYNNSMRNETMRK